MVVGLSCSHVLGTALESEGRSKPTRQDSRRPVENADSRGVFSLIALVSRRSKPRNKEERSFIYMYKSPEIFVCVYEKFIKKSSSKIK